MSDATEVSCTSEVAGNPSRFHSRTVQRRESATTTFAMLTPEAVLYDAAWSKLMGPEPFQEFER